MSLLRKALENEDLHTVDPISQQHSILQEEAEDILVELEYGITDPEPTLESQSLTRRLMRR